MRCYTRTTSPIMRIHNQAENYFKMKGFIYGRESFWTEDHRKKVRVYRFENMEHAWKWYRKKDHTDAMKELCSYSRIVEVHGKNVADNLYSNGDASTVFA